MTSCVNNALKSCPVLSTVCNITFDPSHQRNISHDVTQKHFQDQKSIFLSLSLRLPCALQLSLTTYRLFATQFYISMYFLSLCQTQKSGWLFNPLAEQTQTFLLPGARSTKITLVLSSKIIKWQYPKLHLLKMQTVVQTSLTFAFDARLRVCLFCDIAL